MNGRYWYGEIHPHHRSAAQRSLLFITFIFRCRFDGAGLLSL